MDEIEKEKYIPRIPELFNKSKGTIFAPWINGEGNKNERKIFNDEYLTRCWILSEFLSTNTYYFTWCDNHLFGNFTIKHEKIGDNILKDNLIGSKFEKSILLFNNNY